MKALVNALKVTAQRSLNSQECKVLCNFVPAGHCWQAQPLLSN